jgi:hypothetical protein
MVANPSIDRHLYSAVLPTAERFADYEQKYSILTDVTRGGYHEVSFSPGAGYYLLSYKGPEVPWQRLIQVGGGGEYGYLYIMAQLMELGSDVALVQNEALNQTLSEFMKPIITRSTIMSDGYGQLDRSVSLYTTDTFRIEHAPNSPAQHRHLWAQKISSPHTSVWWTRFTNGIQQIRTRLAYLSSM